jgi:type II secretion system protein L
VIIRSPSGDVTVVDELSMQPALELLLDQQLEQLENDASVVPVNLLVYCDPETHARYAELWNRLQMRVQDIDVRLMESGALPLLAGQIATKGGVNLLQGEFAPKSELPLRWQEWRVAVLLLAGLLLLNLALKGAEFVQLNRTNAALDAAAGQIVQQAFPEVANSPDPWNELRSRLSPVESGAKQSNAAFADALDTLSGAFAQTPEIRMESLSFRSGELSLQFTAPDVATVDKLRQLIGESRRFSAEIQSANPEDDVVKGRMLIVAAGES